MASLFFLCLFLSASGRTSSGDLTKTLGLYLPKKTNSPQVFKYEEKLSRLEHSFEPWMQSHYQLNGFIQLNNSDVSKVDSFRRRNKTMIRSSHWGESFVRINFNDTIAYRYSQNRRFDEALQLARYTPVPLLKIAELHGIPDYSANGTYHYQFNDKLVDIVLSSSHEILRFNIKFYDDLHGDVTTSIQYLDHLRNGGILQPATIVVSKINGRLRDTINVSKSKVRLDFPDFSTKTTVYKADPIPKNDSITVERNGRLTFLNLHHTDDKVLVVEFDSFLTVCEAPLSSRNGELIIRTVRDIYPNKPIRYFMFGHYHPHYTGGIRPFIHKGATIIATQEDVDYVQYLATTSHSLQPDSLHLQPKPVRCRIITDSLVISDKDFAMHIYHIGSESKHTKDYLIYYFPSLRLLFEDDLVWIKKEGEPGKAGGRQKGLYHAILKRKLQVDTIIQSWPLTDYGVKTTIPFEDLERSVIGTP